MSPESTAITLHATAVALGPQAVLLMGVSGSGKSATALQMIALGGTLVADDRTHLAAENGRLIARCPQNLTGLIEARGVGLLRVPYQPNAEIVLAVAMDTEVLERMPLPHHITLCGVTVPLLHNPDAPYFPAALHTYLQMWRRDQSPLMH